MLFYLIFIQYLASGTFNMNTLLVGVEKREAHINWPMVIPVKKGSMCYWNYLEDYWPVDSQRGAHLLVHGDTC